MSIQNFACPACGSRKTLTDVHPGEKIHCTCGMSYPASPVFAVADAGGEKTSGPGLAVAVAVALLVACGGSAIWILTRPAPHQSVSGPIASAPAPVEPQPNPPDDTTKPIPPPDATATTVPPLSPDSPPPDKTTPDKPAPPPTHPAPPPMPLASIAADTLWDWFELDPAAATTRFTGKLVEVTAHGHVAHDSIERPYFGAEVIKAGRRTKKKMTDQEKQWEKDGYPPNVRCYLTSDLAEALEKLPADKEVVLRGICTGRKDRDDVYGHYIVELDDCKLVTK